MKASFIILALALGLSVSAAPQGIPQQDNGLGNFGFDARKSRKGRNGRGTDGAGAAANSTNVNPVTNGTAVLGAAGNGTAAGGAGTAATNADPQTSLTLDPKVIASGFANNGQNVPAAGQVASLTSTNNFINFCLTVPNLPITNGKQIVSGSCNPAPMGIIPSSDDMPSSKFVNPKNGDTLKENTAFTISMAVKNFQTGAFVNAQENYFAAPQQLNGQGQIVGHSHVVVELLTALDQTTPLDPKTFAFFKGLNAAAVGGVLTADVTKGLPAGVYKLSSINTAANHQPVLVPIAQHGSLDDAVYFTVTASGAPAAAGAAGAAAAAAAGANAAAGAAGGQAAAAATSAVNSAAAAAQSAAAAGGAGAGIGGILGATGGQVSSAVKGAVASLQSAAAAAGVAA